jgi:spermidine/putrescine transport system ATP-binding protein/putrescine transport system ATP-binding protein
MVTIEHVTKKFGEVIAVDDVSIDIRANEFFALLGPSGCGKTTLLRMIAGFEQPSSGQLLIDGEDITNTPPNHRPVNMVFQSYAVFPHMSVADNVAYGLVVTGVPKAEIGPRVEEALAMVRLEDYGARQPSQLSGGQRQRVALARALIKRPKVLLLDEPLSALDRKLREEMQLELVRLQHEVGITFVIVTHDQEEALSMADRIAVMDKGKLLQVAPPSELYDRPNCRMVADFIGKTNLFGAKAGDAVNGLINVIADDLGELRLPDDGQGAGAVEIAVRPEKIDLLRKRPEGPQIALSGTVDQQAFFGDASHIYVRLPSDRRIVCHRAHRRGQGGETFSPGDPCWAVLDEDDVRLLRG